MGAFDVFVYQLTSYSSLERRYVKNDRCATPTRARASAERAATRAVRARRDGEARAAVARGEPRERAARRARRRGDDADARKRRRREIDDDDGATRAREPNGGRERAAGARASAG